MSEYRVGTGFDAHALEDGVALVLGGVRIEHASGLAGHSDGDVLAHALTDAVLGAAGLEDIGALFSSDDPALEGADSIELLRKAWSRVQEGGWELVNADVVLDGKATVGYACSLPVRWDGVPEPRGLDWAMSNGAAGDPTTLCAVVVALQPSHRGQGLSEVILRRMAGIGAAHGLDCLIAPVRPTWKERYPLTAIERYLQWRREDGSLYDPWLRTHE